MKTKTLAIVEIAIVLCSLFLAAIPAIAAQEQNHAMQEISASSITTASEDDHVLGVYGNANEDDTIDMGDVVYTKLAIFGKKPKTKLCDAKYDGRINVLDVIQTKLIILGKEKELTVVDSADRTVTIDKPVERIVVCNPHTIDMMRSLRATEDIVGVTEWIIQNELFYGEFADYPNVGSHKSPDYEVLLNCNPDIVFLYGTFSSMDPIENKLKELNPRIRVVRLDCFKPESYVREAATLGYMLDHESEAETFINFYEGFMNKITDKVRDIPEDERPEVYFESSRYRTLGRTHGWHQMVVTAGGRNIFADLESYFAVDAEEVVERDPEIIIRMAIGSYATSNVTELTQVWDEVMTRPELSNVRAVQNRRVYITSYAIMGCGPIGGRHFVGIGYLAKWFYPDLFEDLDPEAVHKEYLREFQGLDEHLVDDGVFVYHPEEHPDGH